MPSTPATPFSIRESSKYQSHDWTAVTTRAGDLLCKVGCTKKGRLPAGWVVHVAGVPDGI